MTWCICTFTRQDAHMDDNLMRYLNAIAGVISAMKLLADRMGKAFALSLEEEPRVSYLEIIELAWEYATVKWNDVEWMKLMVF
jgi:hypothetical protein